MSRVCARWQEGKYTVQDGTAYALTDPGAGRDLLEEGADLSRIDAVRFFYLYK